MSINYYNMGLFDRFRNNNIKNENIELKKDIEALTQFSHGAQLSSIDERTLQLMNSGGFKSTEFNDEILIQLWEEVPEISTVISKISDRAKAVPWGHFKIKDASKFAKLDKSFNDFLLGKTSLSSVIQLRADSLEPVRDPRVARLLTNPNDLQSWSEMIEQLVTYWYVVGNAYNIALGSFGDIPDELNVMASQQTDVIIKDSFLKNPFQINPDESAIEKYTFDNGFGNILTYNDPSIILHMKAPNIVYKNGAWRKGFSPLAAAILASRTLKHEYISRLSLIRDRGMMGMLVGDGKGEKLPTPKETEGVYKRLQKFGLGDGKQNPYGATNGAFKWLNMSMNSGELELLKGPERNLKVLARKMNVPTDLLIGESTRNNGLEAGRIIYTSNVMPWLGNYQEKINKLMGLPERGEVIMPIYDNIVELQQDMKVQSEIYTSLYDSNLATNEEARKGVGLSAIPESGELKDNDSNISNQE